MGRQQKRRRPITAIVFSYFHYRINYALLALICFKFFNYLLSFRQIFSISKIIIQTQVTTLIINVASSTVLSPTNYESLRIKPPIKSAS